MERVIAVAALPPGRPGTLDWVHLRCRLVNLVRGCRRALTCGSDIPDLALRSFTTHSRRGDRGTGGDVEPQLGNWTASVLPLPALDLRLGVEQPLLLTGEDWRDCPSARHQLNCPMHLATPAMFSIAAGTQRRRGSTVSADTLGWQERVCCSSQRRCTTHNRSFPRAGLLGLWCASCLRVLLAIQRQRRSGL